MHNNSNSKAITCPTIFLLEEDDDTRQTLKSNLRKIGFRMLVAVDMEDALEWMSTGYIHADLVLVDLVHKSPQEALEVGRKLRHQAKYDGHTPLVVIAEKFTKELEGTDDNVSGNDWISYPEDAAQLQRLLLRLTLRNAA
jgi:DNA-binding response OmpR family regulator